MAIPSRQTTILRAEQSFMELKRNQTMDDIAKQRAELLTAPGKTPSEICAILDSHRPAQATHEDIYFCFRLLLGRSLNPEEMSGHMSAIGQELHELVPQFLRSAEFASRNLFAPVEGEFQLVHLDGYDMYIDPTDHAVGKSVANGIPYEEHVAAAFRRFVKPGDTVVDIGANLGFFSMLAAHLVGDQGKVFSIEPNAGNCRFIEASREHNAFRHLTLHCVAASNQNDALVLNSAYSNGSVSVPAKNVATLMRSQIVPGICLDDLLKLDRLDFVKIDVEGFEYRALSGFKELLGHFRPPIVSEFSPTAMPSGEAEAYLDLLFGLGYRIDVLDFDGVTIPCGIDAAKIMDTWKRMGFDHVDLLASPD
jgi:FkbM family methyltransferase